MRYDTQFNHLKEAYKKIEEGMFGLGGNELNQGKVRKIFKKAVKNSNLDADDPTTRYVDVGWARHNQNPNIFWIRLPNGPKDDQGRVPLTSIRFLIDHKGVHVSPGLVKNKHDGQNSGWVTFDSAIKVLEEALKLEKWDAAAYRALANVAEPLY